MKLTLGQAAKHAKRAKGSISNALKNGQLSGEMDGKGRWQIDPAELNRWVDANPSRKPKTAPENQETTPTDNPIKPQENRALEVEVKLLREQIAMTAAERERERDQFTDQIEKLHTEAERRSREHTQALALLTDQRKEPQRRGLWARLTGG